MTLNVPSVFGKTDDDLKDRWQQSGCTIVNIYADIADSATSTLQTVTAGKKIYINQIVIETLGVANTLAILDNATTKSSLRGTTTSLAFTFVTPLEFSTSVKGTAGAAAHILVTMTGWEE